MVMKTGVWRLGFFGPNLQPVCGRLLGDALNVVDLLVVGTASCKKNGSGCGWRLAASNIDKGVSTVGFCCWVSI